MNNWSIQGQANELSGANYSAFTLSAQIPLSAQGLDMFRDLCRHQKGSDQKNWIPKLIA
jgi:hypothetical protein